MSPLPLVGLSVGFDASPLLPWLAAAVMPLLLAWWARRRLPRIPFGGFPLLEEAARATAGRAANAGWLLLVLRMVLLATAALAAAGPAVLTGASAGDYRQQNSGNVGRVVVVAAEQPAAATSGNNSTSRAILAAVAATGDGLMPFAVATKATLAEAISARRSGDLQIICDGLVPSPQEAAAWWQWIEAGGTALVLLGPETLAGTGWSAWREALAGRTGLTVAEAMATGGSQLAVKPDLLPAGSAARPIAESLNRLKSVAGPTIDRVVSLGVTKAGDELEILAATAQQAVPVAVCLPLGRGAVTISALPLSLQATGPTPADSVDRWSDLTAWPVFLPYVRGLIVETAARCKALRGSPSSWWAIPALPGLLLLVALLAWVFETALASAGWQGGLPRLLTAAVLVALAWQVARSPAAGHGGEGEAAELPPVDGAAVELVEAALPPLCWPGEEVEIPVTLAGQVASPLRLVLDSPVGRLAELELVPATSTAAAAAAADTETVRLLWQVDQDTPPGPCRLQLGCLPVAGEQAAGTSVSSRLLEATTTIADRPARLLLVDAEPRFEYRFALQAMAGDPRFLVTGRLLAVDRPITASDWAEHDVVWLGDCLGLPVESAGVSPPGMPAAAVESLGQRLAAGQLAVAWQPGERFRQTGFAIGAAARWLPAQAAGPLAPPLRTGTGLRLMPKAAGIASGWLPAGRASLGEVYGLLQPVGLGPTTVTLAAANATGSSVATPAIVLGRHGRGIVLGHLCETWRWRADRLPDGKNLHETYWRQTLCRLATPPLLRRLGVEAEAISWPQRFTRPQPVGSEQSAERAATGSGQPRHWTRQLLLAMLVASCLVAWWPQPWPTQSREG
jgi:hypothetical protein